MKCFLSLLLYVACGVLISCSQAGLQGTNLPSKFNGLDSAVAISPTAVKLSWPLQARFKEYKIYRKGFNSPVKRETFATTKIESLASDTYYEYSVAGVDAMTEDEFGYANYMTVKTMSNFTGIPASGLSSQANGAVEVSWVKNGEGVTYKIYAKRESETWDLTDPVATAVNKSTTVISTLPSGSKYCFWVVAFYEDGTFEPTNMSESYLNSKAPCALVQSQLANLPTVSVNSAFIGSFPWFWAEFGDPTYKTEVYERFTDIRVATITGPGYFRSILPISPGRKNLYAKVTATDGKVTIVDVHPEGSGTTTKPLIRTLEGSGAPAPLLPRLVGDGLGMQELGRSIVTGDFNCDGYKDVAVSAPRSTPYINARHYDGMGAVAVFYGYQPPDEIVNGQPTKPPPRLKTDVDPSPDAAFPNPQLIYYTTLGTNTRLGQKLAVGNVNGDCFSRYTPPVGETDNDPKIGRVGTCDDLYTPVAPPLNPEKAKKIYSCDDLAIQTVGDGSVFVVYGDPVQGLVTGSAGSAFGDNEATCDPGSFKCRPSRYKGNSVKTVQSIAFGDYNNDGFDDLAMGVQLDNGKRQVRIMRGDRFGLYPVTESTPFAIIDAASLDPGILTDGAFTGTTSATAGFGDAVATAYNSRMCVNNSPAGHYFRNNPAPQDLGFDFSKCDDLVIGVPDRAGGRGSIIACKGVQPNTGTNAQKQIITGWTCKESYPGAYDEGTNFNSNIEHITVKGYGATLLGVPNQGGYPLFEISGGLKPNISGAVFVGAPSSTISGAANAGAVFGYYMTPRSSDYAQGGIVGILEPVQEIVAANTIACDSRNRNVVTVSLTVEHCENQVLHTSPAEAGVMFGSSMGSVDDIENLTRNMPSLAIGAPYRSVTSSDGKKTITSHGVAYLYRPDVSTFGIDGTTRVDVPKYSPDDSAGCTTGCTWYSGGVNPFGPSIIYAQDMTAGTRFGGGGLAGGDFNGDKAGDLIIGATFLSTPAYYNGGAFIFNSKGSFAASVNTPDEAIKVNFSKELNYHYEKAKVVGDLNGDGYADVVTHISVASTVELVVFYGSASGLITTPEPSRNPSTPLAPLKLVVDADTAFGAEFHRIGSVNGDAYDDLFITGSKGSYIYYGSSSGLVYASAPAIAPVGQNPLRFGIAGDGVDTVNFHTNGVLQGDASVAISKALFDTSNRSVTYGDFNSDGYSDFAIGTRAADVIAASVIPAGVTLVGNTGRVFVIYGSASGPQTNRSTGSIFLQDSNGDAADVVMENPCTETTPKVCKVQMLASSDTGVYFGWRLTGLSSLDIAAGETSSELVVSDPGFSALRGRIYLYKGGPRGLGYQSYQKLGPNASTGQIEHFGFDLAATGDINGDGLPDVSVAAPGKGKVYAFYGGLVGAANYALFGPSNLTVVDPFATGENPLAVNTQHASQSIPKPQTIDVLDAGIYAADDYFGMGIAAVGDINRDGFADVLVNVPGKDYDLDGTEEDSGAFVIYYGSELGLLVTSAQADPLDPTIPLVPTTTPRCYNGGTLPTCEPLLLYLPERKMFEYSYISNTPSGDINGDGIPDVLLGTPGRNHPSGKAFSTGVVYVLY